MKLIPILIAIVLSLTIVLPGEEGMFPLSEIHMRPACPPLAYSCKFLNFSRSRSEMDLATRKAVRAIDGPGAVDFAAYIRAGTARYQAVEEWIRKQLNLTTLKYQEMDDMIAAIGLPREKLCTYCWSGQE